MFESKLFLNVRLILKLTVSLGKVVRYLQQGYLVCRVKYTEKSWELRVWRGGTPVQRGEWTGLEGFYCNNTIYVVF